MQHLRYEQGNAGYGYDSYKGVFFGDALQKRIASDELHERRNKRIEAWLAWRLHSNEMLYYMDGTYEE